MTSSGIGQAYLQQATTILGEARRLAEQEVWHLAVRRSQEVVELATKALLRDLGVEVPHPHDVAPVLVTHADQLPELTKTELDTIRAVSRRLRLEREASFYGQEDIDVPPDELYTQADAAGALADAQQVPDLCAKCVG